MSVRTTVDLPEELHALLSDRAQRGGTSLRALIVGALERTYGDSAHKGRKVTGPMVCGSARTGPRFPTDRTPHDLILP